MAFKRTGTPTQLETITEYDREKEIVVLCSSCHNVLGYKQGSLTRIGNTITIGTSEIICANCKSKEK